jgi:hypothetical protein
MAAIVCQPTGYRLKILVGDFCETAINTSAAMVEVVEATGL